MDNIEILRNVNGLLRKNSLDELEIEKIFSNPELIDFIINRTASQAFYKIMGLLNNPQMIIDKRKNIEIEAINNLDSIDNLETRRQLISQMYFGDYSENILYTVETILERIETKKEFRENINEQSMVLLKTLKNFFELSVEQLDEITINNFINELHSVGEKVNDDENNLSQLISKTFTYAQITFMSEIREKLSQNNVTKDIRPKTMNASNGSDVDVYLLQAQTDYQKNFIFLTRTFPIKDYMFGVDAMDKYIEDISNREYLSYSLMNDEIYSGFVSKHRITFGYVDMEDNSLMSANTHDGQTNQYTLKDDFYVIKQQYLGLESFMQKTENYNELVLKNKTSLRPNCIIITDPEPTQEVLDAAAGLNLPIICIDPNYYKKHDAINPVSQQDRLKKWYNHESLLPYNLGDIAKKNKTL